MNWLARLFGRPKAERRTGGGVSVGFLAPGSAGYGNINSRMAENLSTVTACVGAISSTMGSLPALVYRKDAAGRMEMPDHPVARLIRRPNGWQTWPDWMEWTLSQTLLTGNSVSVIEYDGAGRPTGLIPIPWHNVQVFLMPSGQLAYDILRYTAPWGGTGQPRRFLEGEVFHLKDRSDDALLGRSRVSRAPEVLGQALGIQDYATSIWQNAATPSGALSHPGKLSPEATARLTSEMERRFAGSANAKKIMVLEEGMTWNALSISPEDAEVLASRRFTVEELCRLFNVPPPIVQDYTHNTFTNASQASLWFAQLTLTPWARKIEAEFSRTIFSDEACHLEIDLSGLTRGDYAARWQAHEIAVRNQILDANEVREVEGWNPRPQQGQQQPVEGA